MSWDGEDILRDVRRMRRLHERGEPQAFSLGTLNAIIDFLEGIQECVRMERKADDPEQAEREAYRSAAGILRATMDGRARRAASALRQDGVEDWATFLPGFDEQFPKGLLDPEGPETGDD